MTIGLWRAEQVVCEAPMVGKCGRVALTSDHGDGRIMSNDLALGEHGIGCQESCQRLRDRMMHHEQDALVIANCPTVADDAPLQVTQCHWRGRVLFDALAIAGKIALQKCFDPLAFKADDLCV